MQFVNDIISTFITRL